MAKVSFKNFQMMFSILDHSEELKRKLRTLTLTLYSSVRSFVRGCYVRILLGEDRTTYLEKRGTNSYNHGAYPPLSTLNSSRRGLNLPSQAALLKMTSNKRTLKKIRTPNSAPSKISRSNQYM